MNNEALHTAYRDRLALLRLGNAKPIVGYVGNTVPVEMITAAGCVPLRIAPVEGDTAFADRYVESISDPDVRRIFELYGTGALDGLAMLIIPRSTESQHKLYLCLREARRTGVIASGPALWLCDILHTQRESSRAYSLTRIEALWAELQKLGGGDEASLRSAISQANATRTQLQTLHEQRWQQPVSGREALVATGALLFMAPEAGAQALSAFTHQPATGPRLLVRGVPLDHDALHALVEDCGARIVAEDDDWGARAGSPLVNETVPPLQALAAHYASDVPCVRVHPARDEWFHAALHRKPDGVLFHLPPPDDVHGWSYPDDRALTDSLSVPSLLIRTLDRAALQNFINHVQR